MSLQRTASRPLLARVTGARSRAFCVALAIAAIGLVMSATIGSAAAQTGPVVVYNSIPASLPSNISPSQNFGGDNTNQFGDLVTLAPGPRALTKVSVALVSGACGDAATSGTATCSTPTPGSYTHPLTVTLYNNAGTLAAPTAGSVIATANTTATIPFRPSADTDCVGDQAGFWQDSAGACWSAVPFVVDFAFPAGTMLPDTLIWGISFNTGLYGSAPIGEPGQYDFLNVGLSLVNPTIGTDVSGSTFSSNGTPPGPFVVDSEDPGENPMVQISTLAQPTATTTTSPAPTTTAPAGTPTTAAPVASTTAGSQSAELAATGGGTGLPVALLAITTGLAFLVLARLRRAA